MGLRPGEDRKIAGHFTPSHASFQGIEMLRLHLSVMQSIH
jgi:hypothetical protein